MTETRQLGLDAIDGVQRGFGRLPSGRTMVWWFVGERQYHPRPVPRHRPTFWPALADVREGTIAEAAAAGAVERCTVGYCDPKYRGSYE